MKTRCLTLQPDPPRRPQVAAQSGLILRLDHLPTVRPRAGPAPFRLRLFALKAVHLYSSENHGYTIPFQTPIHGTWWNIMVDGGYLNAASNNKATGPQIGTVFNCPSGNTDVFPPSLTNSTTVPATRTDRQGAMPYRSTSPITNITVDCWYGMNASDGSDTMKGQPCHRIEIEPRDRYMMMNYVKKGAEMVMFFDGLIYHHAQVNANRINARHGRQTQTNLAFFDGHAITYPTVDLPGGLGAAQTSDFTAANLQANFPPPSHPMWLLEQQY
jgi:prepilin-type processing-associated H-X9-DG protein